VPAARLALRNGVGVGVATRTNALLDQLMYRELPALAEALAEEGPEAAAFRYVALKGYEHYPCLRKLDRLLAEGETPPVPLADVAATVAWVAQSSWDDLDALNVHRNEDYRIAVTSVADECAKRRCRFYPGLCYVHGIRQRAQAAHVVVTNHSLLFNDVALAGGILPPLRYWVVDEAHSAEDQARDQLSRRFSFSATRSSLSSLTMRDRASVVAAVRAAVVPGHGSAAVGEDLTEALLSLAEQLGVEAATAATVLSNFAEYVSDVPELSACRSGGSERVTDQLRATGAFASAMGVGRSLVKRLTDTVRLGTELAALLEEAGEDLAEQRGELRGRIGPLAGQLDALASFVNGDDPDYVYVFRANRYGKPDGLVSARLHIGPALVADFFPAVRSAVFTSATLAVGDDFRHFENEVGLSGAVGHAQARLALRPREPDDRLRGHGYGRSEPDTRVARQRGGPARGRTPLDGRLRTLALHQPPRDAEDVRGGRLSSGGGRHRGPPAGGPRVGEAAAPGVPGPRAPIALRDALVLGGLRRPRRHLALRRSCQAPVPEPQRPCPRRTQGA
jgi:ATP-dependent DNA helicase DinG